MMAPSPTTSQPTASNIVNTSAVRNVNNARAATTNNKDDDCTTTEDNCS
jgi:hypothetical protein